VITIQQAITEGHKQLSGITAETIANPQREALLLLEYACQKNKEFLIAHCDESLNTTSYQHYQDYLARRVTGEPMAYITQEKEFWSLSLKVKPGVLIPRPETELLVEASLAIANKPELNILELGTGSGCIALALAKQLPKATIIASDNSRLCLQVAQLNAIKHQCKNIFFIESNWFKQINQYNFDIIISNPPYISPDDINIEQNVQAFEPHSALFSSNHGFSDLYHIIQHASKYLIPGGTLLLEHGYQQAKTVRTQFEKFGYNNIHTLKDLQQYERVTQGSISH